MRLTHTGCYYFLTIEDYENQLCPGSQPKFVAQSPAPSKVSVAFRGGERALPVLTGGGRAGGLTRVKPLIVRAGGGSEAQWGAGTSPALPTGMRQRLGLRPRLSTARSAVSGTYYCYHWVSHCSADEDTEEGQTLVLASFANIVLVLAISWKREKSV